MQLETTIPRITLANVRLLYQGIYGICLFEFLVNMLLYKNRANLDHGVCGCRLCFGGYYVA